MLAAVLLTAGADTTRNQLAASVQVLCEHPDQWALLAEHPELAMNAVEETMRHSPVVFGAMRVATPAMLSLAAACTIASVRTSPASSSPRH